MRFPIELEQALETLRPGDVITNLSFPSNTPTLSSAQIFVLALYRKSGGRILSYPSADPLCLTADEKNPYVFDEEEGALVDREGKPHPAIGPEALVWKKHCMLAPALYKKLPTAKDVRVRMSAKELKKQVLAHMGEIAMFTAVLHQEGLMDSERAELCAEIFFRGKATRREIILVHQLMLRMIQHTLESLAHPAEDALQASAMRKLLPTTRVFDLRTDGLPLPPKKFQH